ncbi:MAG: NYN domain-containing protein [Bacteroidota bacterium]|nr:NYN domain-containing protein [Bacteroidota bacterium]
METILNNYAFIDSQNLNLGIQELGWKLDFKRFRIYLEEKYNVEKAYLFIGYLPENQDIYTSLQNYGYVLVFKPVLKNKKGEVKGNVDADLVLQA